MDNDSTRRLVLASGSPRRRELLALLGLPFEVQAAPGDESSPGRGEAVEETVQRLALEKAQAVAAERSDALVLGADTLVALDGQVFGKPSSSGEAVAMLERLRGQEHQVITGLALVDGATRRAQVDHKTTTVVMRPYSREEVLRYVASDEPLDKAGGYAVQDPSFAPAQGVEGCYLNVVGLPLCLTALLLKQAGLAPKVLLRGVADWCPGCALVPEGRSG